MGKVRDLFGGVGVVPVLELHGKDDAVRVARVLVEAGLPVLEVVLRTRGALEALRAIADHVDGAVVGAGTVTDAVQFRGLVQAGARFAVSPGLVPSLVKMAQRADLPFLPGVATASEAMAARDLGFREVKLFPAEPAGGTAFLRAMAGPLPDIAFCPTGGVTETNLGEYFAHDNVFAVGGSWIAPPALVAEGHWAEIVRRATQAREIFAQRRR